MNRPRLHCIPGDGGCNRKWTTADGWQTDGTKQSIMAVLFLAIIITTTTETRKHSERKPPSRPTCHTPTCTSTRCIPVISVFIAPYKSLLHWWSRIMEHYTVADAIIQDSMSMQTPTGWTIK